MGHVNGVHKSQKKHSCIVGAYILVGIEALLFFFIFFVFISVLLNYIEIFQHFNIYIYMYSREIKGRLLIFLAYINISMRWW